MPSEVPLEKVEDGATLAEDVLDARGNVLLAAGTKLTKAHISLIQRRGIASVTILAADEPAAGEGAGSALRMEDLLARHDEVFSQTKDIPLMEDIRRASRAHIEAGNFPPG